ncbi:CpaF family protein [Jiangella rhizosphaerae]|nr:CpaF/VirB11 family protein [Jiangella rhizosphaerae]
MTDDSPHTGDITSLPIFDTTPRPDEPGNPARHAARRSPREILSAFPTSTTPPPPPVPVEAPPTTPLLPPTVETLHAAQPAAPAHDNGPGFGWDMVRIFRIRAAERLSTQITNADKLTDAQRRARGHQIIQDLVNEDASERTLRGEPSLSIEDREAFAKAVYDALFGLGRLQPYIDDDDVENVEVYGADQVVVERSNGRLDFMPPAADSVAELNEFLQFLATRGGARERSFSEASPELHLNLHGGYRMAAVGWISHTTVITIRRHRLVDIDLDDLVQRDTLTPDMARFLIAAVKAKRSVLVAGGQGFGKTTLIRALANAIDPLEKLGTIETEYELLLHKMPERHRRIIAWEARPGSGERQADGSRAGEVTLDQLVFGALRQNLDRMIVGEVRGKEVLPMFKAMQSGAGSLSTTHAHSARAAIERLVTCAMEAGSHVTEEFAYRQIAEHIDIIVHLNRRDVRTADGTYRRRYIDEIVAVEPGEHGRPALTDVFTDNGGGQVTRGAIPPQWIDDLIEHGYDPTGFQAGARA